MYLPQPFEEPRLAVMGQLMRDYPLASVVTVGSQGLTANPIPLEWLDQPAPWGCLRGHAARANPFWQDCQGEVLAIFHGPDAYISPSWYASKRETGKVVPTWNYATVHAYGRLVVHEEPAWLLEQLGSLVDRHEADLPGPWRLADAPDGFIDSLLPAIVGIEIIIDRLQGKWKTSQNRSPADRAGVAAGLRRVAGADTMAGWVWPADL